MMVNINVPFNPIPQQGPSLVPTPFRTAEGATPDVFGAGVGRAIEGLGQQLQHAGEVVGSNVLQAQQYKNEADVNTAITSSIEQAGEETNRFRMLPGSQAQDQLQEHVRKLQSIREGLRGSLTNPRAQQAFDQGTMHRFALDVVNSSNYAATQMKQYEKQTNLSAQDSVEQYMIKNWQTPGVIESSIKQISSLESTHASGDGASSDELSARVRTRLTKAFENLAPAMAKSDPDKAQAMFDKVKDKLDAAAVPGIQNSINDRGVAYHAAIEADRITRGLMGPSSVDRVHASIIQQESGGREGAPTSVTGAMGIGQIQPATFREYARPGEDIRNPKDNYNVSRRIVEDLYNRFGGDPARVAVGYFSGPGNVAPPGSATPWKVNAADPTGKTTASYVADVTGRMQRTPVSGRDPETSLADMHRQAELVADKIYPLGDHPSEQDVILHNSFIAKTEAGINNTAALKYKEIKDRQVGLTLYAGQVLNQNVPSTGRKPINVEEANAIDPNFDKHTTELLKLNPNYERDMKAKFKANASEDKIIPQSQRDAFLGWFDKLSSDQQAAFKGTDAFNAGQINQELLRHVEHVQATLGHAAADTTNARAIMENNSFAIADAFTKQGYPKNEMMHMKAWLEGTLANRIREMHKDAPVKEEEGARMVDQLLQQAPTPEVHGFLNKVWSYISEDPPQLQFEREYREKVKPEWVEKFPGAERAPDGNWYVQEGEKYRQVLPPKGG